MAQGRNKSGPKRLAPFRPNLTIPLNGQKRPGFRRVPGFSTTCIGFPNYVTTKVLGIPNTMHVQTCTPKIEFMTFDHTKGHKGTVN